MHYLVNAWLEKSGMLRIYAPWCDLEAYRRGVTVINYFLRKMGKILESISMEGQGHTIDLIFTGSTYHAEGSCIQ